MYARRTVPTVRRVITVWLNVRNNDAQSTSRRTRQLCRVGIGATIAETLEDTSRRVDADTLPFSHLQLFLPLLLTLFAVPPVLAIYSTHFSS